MAHKKRQKRSTRDIIGNILFVTLILSSVYSFVRILVTPTSPPEGIGEGRGDYVLMFIQCLLGLCVFSLPSLVNRRWKVVIPSVITIMYYVFLYCAIFLGEVLSFYYVVPHWDTILHFFSGAMLGALGFILVKWMNDDELVRVSLSPAFISLFAFCFALSCGAVWEIYEYAFDGLLGLNMQKFITATGEVLVGHSALTDTMKDIIVDAAAALFTSVSGYISLKARRSEKGEAADAV